MKYILIGVMAIFLNGCAMVDKQVITEYDKVNGSDDKVSQWVNARLDAYNAQVEALLNDGRDIRMKAALAQYEKEGKISATIVKALLRDFEIQRKIDEVGVKKHKAEDDKLYGLRENIQKVRAAHRRYLESGMTAQDREVLRSALVTLANEAADIYKENEKQKALQKKLQELEAERKKEND